MNTQNLKVPYTLLLIICLVLCITHDVLGQSKKFSSKGYSGRTKNALITDYLDSAQYLSAKAPLRAIDKINKAIELSINDNDKNNEALSYWILGNIQQNLEQHELASSNYKKCISTILSTKKSKSIKDSAPVTEESVQTLFNAYKYLSQSLLQLNKTEEAASYISKCFGSQFNAIPDKDISDAKRVQASILTAQGKDDESLNLLSTVLEQEKKSFHLEGEAKTLIAIGSIYQQNKNENKAIENYSRAKIIAEKTKNTSLLFSVNNLLAQIFRQQKNIDKELEVRNSNIANSNSKEISQQNIEIGNAYANTNQMNKALPFFEKGLYNDKEGKVIVPEDLFGKSKDLEGMANTYKLLAEEYLKMGDSERALAYLKTFILIQDSIKFIRKKELDDALKLSNQIGKNQQRIELLEKERNLSEKSIEILKQDKDLKEDELYTRNIIIGSLIFLLTFMFIGVYYILKSSKEKRRANQLLAIKSLRGQMNPHFIFNALNSVNHYISQNDERAANKYLSDFSKLMRSVMETSKHDLISLNEELEILKLYLQLEHARFKEKFDYTFHIDEHIDTTEFELPPMIIQPFIENAIWHGLRYIDGKGILTIEMKQNTEGLLVSIIDNGIGRKKSLEIKTKNQKLQNSTGMQNIENRISIMNELFNTTIKVDITDAFEQNENKGTKINLFIPKKINHHA